MIVMMIGTPGSGRHTQAEMLVKHWGFKHISLRNMLHNELVHKSPFGDEIYPYIKDAKEIPNKLIYELYNEKLSDCDFSHHIVFNGFPVTLDQYNALRKTLAGLKAEISAAIVLNVSTEESIRRLGGLLVCTNCNYEYHTGYRPPEVNSACDFCSQQLTKMENTDPEKASRRIEWYRDVSSSLVKELESNLNLININGLLSVESIHREISTQLELS